MCFNKVEKKEMERVPLSYFRGRNNKNRSWQDLRVCCSSLDAIITLSPEVFLNLHRRRRDSIGPP